MARDDEAAHRVKRDARGRDRWEQRLDGLEIGVRRCVTRGAPLLQPRPPPLDLCRGQTLAGGDRIAERWVGEHGRCRRIANAPTQSSKRPRVDDAR